MATYGDAPAEYPYSPQKRKKQKYTMVTRVVDFTNNLPITHGKWGQTGAGTTAWAAADVLQAVHIRAGQTVLAVQIEVLTASVDTGDFITVGYGSEADRWGKLYLHRQKGLSTAETAQTVKQFPGDKIDTHSKKKLSVYVETGGMYGGAWYFATSDTIDVTIGKAALQGKVRLIVHLLEDDR